MVVLVYLKIHSLLDQTEVWSKMIEIGFWYVSKYYLSHNLLNILRASSQLGYRQNYICTHPNPDCPSTQFGQEIVPSVECRRREDSAPIPIVPRTTFEQEFASNVERRWRGDSAPKRIILYAVQAGVCIKHGAQKKKYRCSTIQAGVYYWSQSAEEENTTEYTQWRGLRWSWRNVGSNEVEA